MDVVTQTDTQGHTKPHTYIDELTGRGSTRGCRGAWGAPSFHVVGPDLDVVVGALKTKQ